MIELDECRVEVTQIVVIGLDHWLKVKPRALECITALDADWTGDVRGVASSNLCCQSVACNVSVNNFEHQLDLILRSVELIDYSLLRGEGGLIGACAQPNKPANLDT